MRSHKKKIRKKTAIIFGITGQDGAYLANFLLNKGYKVIGTTRNKNSKNFFRLKKLNILKKLKIFKGEAININFCKKIINSKISEIYYLAGDSSVLRSYEYPLNSFNSNTLGLLNILHHLKKKKYKTRLFNAGSAQFYGNNKNYKYNLKSKIEPQSVYGISKAAGYWLVKIYREKYNMNCCTGILFNHESILRPDEVVTKKIVKISKKIKNNSKIRLKLGNINIYRDWGWAPEYVEAFWLMLQKNKMLDFIIGTGKIHSIKDFLNEVLKLQKVSKKNVTINVGKHYRKYDLKKYCADTKFTQKHLKWKPKINFKKIIYKMVNDELF